MDKKRVITKTDLAAILLLIILGFILYGNSLKNEFIWDDYSLVVHNAYIANWRYIHKIFTNNIGAGTGQMLAFFRPFQILTYLIDYTFWKYNELGYHLTNIILHISVAICVYWLITLLYKNKRLSFLTSILFICHPLHTEAVTYISGRADPLAALFILLCLIIYTINTHQKNIVLTLIVPLIYILALLAKEYSLITPILLLLIHYNLNRKIKYTSFLPLVLISLLYIVLRLTFLKELLPHNIYYMTSSTAGQRLPGCFVALFTYSRLLILPLNLHMEYGSPLFSWANPKTIAGVFLFCFLLICAYKNRHPHSLIYFSILWFFITLIPVTNVFPLNAYLAEHWLYLPSIGFFLLLANIITRTLKTEKYRFIGHISIWLLIIFYSSLTIRQNNYWKNPVSFYRQTLKYSPDNPKMYNHLAHFYRNRHDYKQAIKLFKKAIVKNPRESYLYFGLGLSYCDINHYEKSIQAFNKALTIDPYLADVYYMLGFVYRKQGKLEAAIANYQRAIENNPTYAPTHNYLGVTYYEIGEIEKAKNKIIRAIELNPDYAEAYNNLGIIFYHYHLLTEAEELFEKAIALNPQCAQAKNNLAKLHIKQEKHTENSQSNTKLLNPR